MSVVSQKVGQHSYRHRLSASGRGPRSVIGAGYDVDQAAYLLPNHHFSALKSEGGIKHRDQDDWGENTTIITSEQSFGGALVERTSHKSQPHRAPARGCVGACGSLLLLCFTTWLVLSAPAMVIIPVLLVQADFYETKELACELDCTASNFVIFIFTIILGYAVWATMKPTNAVLPRVRFRRIAFIFFLVFVVSSFWLFYIVQALLRTDIEFAVIQKLAITLLFVLIVLQLLWVTHDSLKGAQKFRVTVTRDPDGEVREMEVAQSSIQEAVVHILRVYELQFPYFNPLADRARTGAGQKSVAMPNAGFKMYDIDGTGDRGIDDDAIKRMVEIAAKQSAGLCNEYYTETYEKERKTRRKGNRLLLSTEEAFTQINSINKNYTSGDALNLDPAKSAKIVSGAIGKHLHRYLKHTYQQPNFPPELVMHNLEFCFKHGFSARSFLSQFFNKQRPNRDAFESRWTIISDRIATHQIHDGLEFVIRCVDEEVGCVQLRCVVSQFPFYNLTESASPFSRL